MKYGEIKKFIFIALENFEASVIRGETYQKARKFLASHWYELTGENLNNQLENAYSNYVKFSDAAKNYSEDVKQIKL